MGHSIATRRALAALAALLLPMAPAAAVAAASAWSGGDESQVRLISATAAVGNERELEVGVHIRLQPGWKIYWRSPGEAGMPPRFDWAGSENLAGAVTHWPVPKRFMLFDLETLGYTDEVVFPITLALARPGEAMSLRLTALFPICKNICLLHEVALVLDLPAGAAADTLFTQLIQRYLERVPGRGPSAGLEIERVAVSGPPSRRILEVTARADPPFAQPDMFVEGPEGVTFAAPEVELGDGGRTARLSVVVWRGKAAPPLAGRPLTITIVDGERALEREVEPLAAQ